MAHLLTYIPTGTLLYMQPEGKTSPRLGPIRFNAHQFTELPFQFPSFSVIAPGLPSRDKIDIRHLVGYYRKHVGPIDDAYFNQVKAHEILFIADHKFHKDRSMRDLREDYERRRAFEDNYTCDDCYPWACRCPEEEEEQEPKPEPKQEPEQESEPSSVLAKARVFVKGIDKADVSGITERMEGIEALLKEMDPRLEALRATFQDIKKHMSDIRALARALDWAERFPQE
jgi:hypothetical protein